MNSLALSGVIDWGNMKQVIAALCVGLAGCHSGHSTAENSSDTNAQATALTAQAADAEPVSAMLKEGKPEACAHPAVKERILSDINDGMDTLTPASMDASEVSQQDVDQTARSVGEPTLKDTQAVDSDQSVGALTCALHVEFPGQEMTVQYALKPSLDDPGDFLMTYVEQSNAKGMRKGLVQAEVYQLIRKRNDAAEAAALKEHPAPPPENGSGM